MMVSRLGDASRNISYPKIILETSLSSCHTRTRPEERTICREDTQQGQHRHRSISLAHQALHLFKVLVHTNTCVHAPMACLKTGALCKGEIMRKLKALAVPVSSGSI